METKKVMRKIIRIDESKCDGCGICAQACHEGAIAIENGKAKLVSESYCDGLGDCIGECPCGAITFETRAADDYDEAAVKKRLSAMKQAAAPAITGNLPCGCPGSMARELGGKSRENGEKTGAAASQPRDSVNTTTEAREKSTLCNWPVQMKLVPMEASYLKNAALLVAADCTAFAFPAFHSELLPGRVCLIGCPKLDDVSFYREKLAQMIKLNGIKSIDVAYMEVPCCNGLLAAVRGAVSDAGVPVPVRRVRIGLEGDVLECEWL